MTPTPEVVAAAQAAMKATRVPASVSIAQYGDESAWGKDEPRGSDNPFGIKAFHGIHVNAMTTEVVKGRVEHIEQPFAVYPTLDAAFQAHAELIAHDHRYAPAMAALPDLERFLALMGPVYATVDHYDQIILHIIRADALTRYDLPAGA